MKMQSESQAWKVVKSICPIVIPFFVSSAYALVIYVIGDMVYEVTQSFQVVHYMGMLTDNVTIGTAVCSIPFYIYMYRRDYRYEYHKESMGRVNLKGILCVFLLAMASGTLLNNLISFSGIGRIFNNYVDILGALYSNNVVADAIGLGIIVPIAEELLFRGIIYNRIKTNVGVRNGAIITSLLFAVYHGNVVQGIYAFFLSFFIIFAQEKFGTVIMAILFHMGANIFSVLLQETSLQNVLYGNIYRVILSTTVECLIVLLFMSHLNGMKFHREKCGK